MYSKFQVKLFYYIFDISHSLYIFIIHFLYFYNVQNYLSKMTINASDIAISYIYMNHTSASGNYDVDYEIQTYDYIR